MEEIVNGSYRDEGINISDSYNDSSGEELNVGPGSSNDMAKENTNIGPKNDKRNTENKINLPVGYSELLRKSDERLSLEIGAYVWKSKEWSPKQKSEKKRMVRLWD